MQPKGKLYTSNPTGLKKINFDATLLLITRAGADISGTTRVRELAPSAALFHESIEQRQSKPGPEWWPQYEEKFLLELQSDVKINALREVYRRLLRGENIVLVCFCTDHRYCHRRLAGHFFEQYGVQVEELNPVTVEQITLF
ncbi:MAG TPA: DUF488 domain-containing protein [Candidatus Paenibacillus intestinavium]|nr:DUF488 domain-containing protein [Candidatus Paenibacillus intestinavium]